ncbi:hypothetical protein Vafri_5761 [Volvox africanus]|nr:hypothetical protein Vafri_5761 [Volvox africanus]
MQLGSDKISQRAHTSKQPNAISSRAATACFRACRRHAPAPLPTTSATQLNSHSALGRDAFYAFAPQTLPLSTRGVMTAAHGSLPEYSLEVRPPARLAIFVSGGGSNFKAIHAACLDGRINGTVVAVVSDVPSCGGVTHARSHGISTLTYPIVKKGEFQGQGLTAEQLVNELKIGHQVDFVLLAGYLKLIPGELCRAFPRAMLNIHPGLLPSFGGKGYYGERVHRAVIASGARFSGPTVHFVDEQFDTGPILAQRVVPVFPTDTPKQLAARVLKEEHQVYPHCVAALCDGRIGWREDGVPILWEAK